MIHLHTGDPTTASSWYARGLREATWELAPHAHATLLANVAAVRAATGDLIAATAAAEEAATRYHLLGDERAAALSLGNVAFWAVEGRDHDRATNLLGDLLVTFERLADPQALAEAHSCLAEIALHAGNTDSAGHHLDLANRWPDVEDPWQAALADAFGAELLLLRGDPDRAQRQAALARARADQLGYRRAQIRAAFVQAAAAATQADPARLHACGQGDGASVVAITVVLAASLPADDADRRRLAPAALALARQTRYRPPAAATPFVAALHPSTAGDLDDADRTVEDLHREALTIVAATAGGTPEDVAAEA